MLRGASVNISMTAHTSIYTQRELSLQTGTTVDDGWSCSVDVNTRAGNGTQNHGPAIAGSMNSAIWTAARMLLFVGSCQREQSALR